MEKEQSKETSTTFFESIYSFSILDLLFAFGLTISLLNE